MASNNQKISPVILIGGAVAAYFLFFNKKKVVVTNNAYPPDGGYTTPQPAYNTPSALPNVLPANAANFLQTLQNNTAAQNTGYVPGTDVIPGSGASNLLQDMSNLATTGTLNLTKTTVPPPSATAFQASSYDLYNPTVLVPMAGY